MGEAGVGGGDSEIIQFDGWEALMLLIRDSYQSRILNVVFVRKPKYFST